MSEPCSSCDGAGDVFYYCVDDVKTYQANCSSCGGTGLNRYRTPVRIEPEQFKEAMEEAIYAVEEVMRGKKMDLNQVVSDLRDKAVVASLQQRDKS